MRARLFLNAVVRWKHVLLIFMTVTVNYAPSVSLIILLFLKYSIDLVCIAGYTKLFPFTTLTYLVGPSTTYKETSTFRII